MLAGNFNHARLSILSILGAALFFSSNDVLIKLLSDDYSLFQIIAFRGIIALIVTLVIFIPIDGARRIFQTKQPFLLTIRGFLIVVGNLMFIFGLVMVPIAEATAVFFVAPLLVTIFSIFILRENVGPRRWLAVAIGGIGVLLVVQPGGANFQWALLLPLAAANAIALSNVLTRKLGVAERASTMATFVHLNFIVFCLLAGLLFGDGRYKGSGNQSMEFLLRSWKLFSVDDLLMVTIGGIMIAAGAYLITQAYRFSEASLIAPLEYISLINVLFWGYVIWDEIPNLFAWVGITFIVAAGIFIALREAEVGIRR